MADTLGKLVMIEYKTEKYNQETRAQEPCTPHYVFKFALPDGKNAYIRQYDTPKTQTFLAKFKADTGLGVGMDLIGKEMSLYQKQDNPNYPPSWNISTRPAPPAPPATFQQAPAQPMEAPVPPPPGAYAQQQGYAPTQDNLPHMPEAPAPAPFNDQF